MGWKGEPVLPSEADIHYQYLQAELARIDLWVRRAVRRWQIAGQDPGDAFLGLSISDQEAARIASMSFGSDWGQSVRLSPEEEQAFKDSLQQAQNQIDVIFAQAKRRGLVLHLNKLVQAFELTDFERDLLLICLAPRLDVRYERIYGFLQDDVTRRQPSLSLALSLMAPGIGQRLETIRDFVESSAVFRFHLIEKGLGADQANPLGEALQIDATITAWLLGRYQPHRSLRQCAKLVPPVNEPVNQLLSARFTSEFNLAVRSSVLNENNPLIAFSGPDAIAQSAAARLIATHLDRFLLQVDVDKVIAMNAESPLNAVRLALRDARLTGAVPFLTGWDVLLGSSRHAEEGEKGAPVGAPPAALLAELCDYPDLVIVAGQAPWQASGVDRDRAIFSFFFEIPDYPQRLALWEHFLKQSGVSIAEDHQEIAALAGQFALDGGQIRDAIATARDRALQQGRPLEARDLFSAARVHSTSYLGGLAHKIEPRYSWSDIILPEDPLNMLHEIVATVRGRPLVLEEWGLGKKLVSSAGIPILFSGQPGTGKTMAAEVIANELGLDLYKIDLSTVVSKYIGETEKNLEMIFNEAEASNAILFFDEADAIFGKRSEVKDAHDRYANIEVSYLLQRMERYNGVTILATNLRANLDQAFTRRLQFAIDFPFPEAEYRLRIWQTLFPASVPRSEDLDFRNLAHSYKLSGGNIRNVIVAAAYLAAGDGGRVRMDHVLHSIRREMQKMGRLIDEPSKIKPGMV